MVFDWDDLGLNETADARFLGRMLELKAIRPDFRCTLFAVPAHHPERYFAEPWDPNPDEPWIELAVHGWTHSPMECADWTADDVEFVIHHRPARFVEGFKAPFWAINQACYDGFGKAGWWVADHEANDLVRPADLRCNVLRVENSDHWHGHIGNDCGNGIEETWEHVVSLVEDAPSFEFMSEAVTPWRPRVEA